LSILVSLAWLSDGRAQQPGEQDYQALCAPCHTIGGGRLIGPDLAGVHDRRSEEWLMEFVQSSQSMIERGDPEAIAVFEEYSSLLMPDPPLSEVQVRDVLVYLSTAADAPPAAGGQAAVEATPNAAAVNPPATVDPEVALPLPPQAEITRGQDLFQGRARFENGGPTCNSCHDVVNDAVIGGGILSVELTTVFSRLGGRGVQAVVGSSPFPVMQAAYQERALTENEVTSLVSFLQYADQESAFQTPRDYGLGLFISGLIGTVLLFGFFALLSRGRKGGSVNQAIYDRQVKSTWEN
jgi:cytochrome c2